MKVTTKIKRTACYAGGLFLGIKLHFPTYIWDGYVGEPAIPYTNQTYQLVSVNIGLIVWTWTIDFTYNHKPITNVD